MASFSRTMISSRRSRIPHASLRDGPVSRRCRTCWRVSAALLSSRSLQSGQSDRSRKRARARQRHAIRKPREGGPFAMGGRRGSGAGRRPDGAIAAPDRPRPALEVLLAADDAELAELYGYVNRALPDAELDGFVDAMAMRIASFDKLAIAETKRLVDVASLPWDAEIRPEWEAFLAAVNRPASQKRIKALMERGFHRPGDVENRLGFYVGQIGD